MSWWVRIFITNHNYGIRYLMWYWNLCILEPCPCFAQLPSLLWNCAVRTCYNMHVSFNTVQCKEKPVCTFCFVKILLNKNFNYVPIFKSQTVDSYSVTLGNSYTMLNNWKPVWWYDTFIILSLYSFPVLHC